MKVNHFSIYRWGTARIHWEGTKKELAYFREWVNKIVPKKNFSWDAGIGEGSGDVECLKYNETHLSGCFDVSSWTFLCYHWTSVSAPALGQVWTEKDKKYPHATAGSFGENETLLSHDNAVLNLAWADLQKQARKEQTPQLKEAIAFLYAKWTEVRNQLPKHDL